MLFCLCIHHHTYKHITTSIVTVDLLMVLGNNFFHIMLQITTPQEDRRDDEKLYHKVALVELQTMSPFVSMNCILNKFLWLLIYVFRYAYLGLFYYNIFMLSVL